MIYLVATAGALVSACAIYLTATVVDDIRRPFRG